MALNEHNEVLSAFNNLIDKIRFVSPNRDNTSTDDLHIRTKPRMQITDKIQSASVA
jgi:hypothetical protein